MLRRYVSCTAGSNCDLFRARAAPSKFVRERVLPGFKGDVSRREKGKRYPPDAWRVAAAGAPAWSVHHSAVDSAAVHSANARRKRTRGLRTASEGRYRTPLAARLRGAALLHEQLQA